MKMMTLIFLFLLLVLAKEEGVYPSSLSPSHFFFKTTTPVNPALQYGGYFITHETLDSQLSKISQDPECSHTEAKLKNTVSKLEYHISQIEFHHYQIQHQLSKVKNSPEELSEVHSKIGKLQLKIEKHKLKIDRNLIKVQTIMSKVSSSVLQRLEADPHSHLHELFEKAWARYLKTQNMEPPTKLSKPKALN